jgi:transcriptional regulator ATRX
LDEQHKFSGFLIDNIDNELEEIKPEISKSTKRTVSTSSTTTIDSDSVVNDINIIEEINSDSKSKKSDDDDDDDDIEIIKTYPTRSRASTNDPQKKLSSNIYDTGNDQLQPEESNEVNNQEQEENSDQPWLDEMREQFWFPLLDMLPEESKFDIELSGKFLLLKSVIDKCSEIGDKLLLFSRSLYTLNYLEKFLNHLQIENEKEYQKQCKSRRQLRELLSSNGGDDDNVTNEYIPEPIQWIRDQDYFRMDGQTDVTARKRYVKAFNNMSNVRARIFLVSTLAGGIGINLTGSNRVIVFDASWNPR